MMLVNEDQILDQGFRFKVLKEISSQENIDRKKKDFKKYEIFKDKYLPYIADRLRSEGLKEETVSLMLNRASNIAFARKIVNKLSRAYNAGVTRSAEQEGLTTKIEEYAKLLYLNKMMKKADRYRELYKIAMLQVYPEKCYEDDELYKICVRILSPWQYDVIEDYKDQEKARVVILSEFTDKTTSIIPASEARAGVHTQAPVYGDYTDGKDNIIADSMMDAEKGRQQTYIWWSKKYHFTTNAKGEIINELSPDMLENPIQELPFETVAEDQDGYYWPDGGDDLVESSLLANQLVTDMNAIAYMQGYGQVVVTGKNLPQRLTMGPHHALLFNYDTAKEEPEPKVTVVNSNPPLADWMSLIEQQVALLLSTNNLSPGSISMKLDASNYPSGIAMLIEMSEANNDVSDTQKMFSGVEHSMWRKIAKWHNLYYTLGLLEEEYKEIGQLPDDLEVVVKFVEPKPVISEKEKLEILEKRRDLGVNTMAELIQLDNPSMSEEEAKAKLEKITKEKQDKMKQTMESAVEMEEVDPTEGESRGGRQGEFQV